MIDKRDEQKIEYQVNRQRDINGYLCKMLVFKVVNVSIDIGLIELSLCFFMKWVILLGLFFILIRVIQGFLIKFKYFGMYRKFVIQYLFGIR